MKKSLLTSIFALAMIVLTGHTWGEDASTTTLPKPVLLLDLGKATAIDEANTEWTTLTSMSGVPASPQGADATYTHTYGTDVLGEPYTLTHSFIGAGRCFDDGTWTSSFAEGTFYSPDGSQSYSTALAEMKSTLGLKNDVPAGVYADSSYTAQAGWRTQKFDFTGLDKDKYYVLYFIGGVSSGNGTRIPAFQLTTYGGSPVLSWAKHSDNSYTIAADASARVTTGENQSGMIVRVYNLQSDENGNLTITVNSDKTPCNAIAIAEIAAPAAAVEHTRTVDSSDELWSTASEWENSTLPTMSDTVNLSTTVDGARLGIDVLAHIAQLAISGDYALTFAGEGSLTVASTAVNTDTDVSGITASLGAVTLAADKKLTVKTPSVFSSLSATATSVIETTEDCTLASSLSPENMLIRIKGGTLTLDHQNWINKFIVENGATLDINGKGNYRNSGAATAPLITLEGGATLANSVAIGDNTAVMNELALAENATAKVSGKTFRTIAPGYGKTALALNGGTLTVEMDDGESCYFYNMYAAKTVDELSAARSDTLPESTEFAGTVKVAAGNLVFTRDRALFGRAAVVLAPNEGKTASVSLSVDTTLGSISSENASDTLNIWGHAFTVGALGTDTEFAGVVSGTGAFTKVGDGTLKLSGENTHSGSVTVSAGTLAYASDAAIVNAVAGEGTVCADGAVLDLTGASSVAATLKLVTKNNGTIILNQDQVSTIDASAGGTVKVKVSSYDAVDLTAKVTLAEGANVTFILPNGTEVVGSGATMAAQSAYVYTASAEGENQWSTAANWTLNGNAVESAPAGSVETPVVIKLTAASTLNVDVADVNLTAVSVSGGQLTITGNPLTISNLSSTGKVIVANELTLADGTEEAPATVANQIEVASGGKLITTGYLECTAANVIADGGTLEVASGVTTFGLGDRTLSGTLKVANGATFKNGTGDALNYNQGYAPTLDIAGTLEVTGTARWSLSANTTTTLREGAVLKGVGGTGYDYAYDYFNGGTITVEGNATIEGNIGAHNGGTITFNVAEDKVLTVSGKYNGSVFSGSPKLVIDGAGTVKLTGANTYTGGTTINEGATLEAVTIGNLHTSGAIVVDGRLRLANTADVNHSESTAYGTAEEPRLTGSGVLEINGNGYYALPAGFTTPLALENNQASGIVVPGAPGITVGTLSGTGYFRADWGANGDGSRVITVNQSEASEFSGYVAAGNNSTRAMTLLVTKAEGVGEDVDTTLTLSGNSTAAGTTLSVAEGSVVNLAGSWTQPVVGAGTVKLPTKTVTNLNLSNFADASTTLEIAGTVSGYLNNGTWSVAAALKVSGTFELSNGFSSGRYTFTGPLTGDGVIRLARSAAVTDALRFAGDVSGFSGTIEVNDDNSCVVFCAADAAASLREAGKIYVASGSAIVVPAGKTWKANNGVNVYGTIGGTGTIGGALTLNAGATVDATAGALTVSGAVTLGTVTAKVAGTATVGDTILTCSTEGLDLTKITIDGVDGMVAAANADNTAIVLASAAVCSDPNGTSYSTINACIAAMAELGATDFYIYIIADTAEEVTLPADSTLTFMGTGGTFSGTVKDENGNTITPEGGIYDTHTYVASVTVGEETTKCETFDAVLTAIAADTVTDATVTILAATGLKLSSTWVIDGKDITLDLGNTTVEATFTYTADNPAAIWVKNGGALTIKNGTLSSAAEAIRLGVKGATDDTQAGTVTIESTATITSSDIAIMVYGGSTLTSEGKISSTSADYGAIQGNGLETVDTTIAITGGSVISENNHAIYHPQPGKLTIGKDGGQLEPYIQGVTGIEMRAGEVEMLSGNIVATGSYAVAADASGSTVTGAALAISQHTTDAAAEGIKVTVAAGGLSGAKSLAVVNTTEASAVPVTGEIVGTALDSYDITVPTVALEGDAETGYMLKTVVAAIGETKYATIAAAYEAALAGETITLLADATLPTTVVVEKSITLDMGGNTVTAEFAYSADTPAAFWVKNGGNLTLKNGTLSTTVEGIRLGVKQATDPATAGTATIASDAVITTSDIGVILYGGSTLTSSGTITSTSADYAAIQGNGLDTLESTINITGGTVTSESNHAIYHPQPGTLTVSGGEISGVTGIEMRAGSLAMSGGTVTATGTYAEPDANNSGSTVNGAAIVLSQHSTGKNVTANITGGTITATGTDGKTFVVANTTGADPVEVEATIAGNVGITPDTAVVLIDTLELTTDSDGNYSLTEKAAVTYVAQIGDAKYETIAEAFEVATSGDTVELIANAEEYVAIPDGFAGTLDLGGNILTGQVYIANADVVLKNGNIVRKVVGAGISTAAAVQIEAGSLTFTNNVEVYSSTYHLVRYNGSSTGAIYDGRFMIEHPGTAGYQLLYINGTSHVKVYGGEFIGNFTTEKASESGVSLISMKAGALVEVYGGVFTRMSDYGSYFTSTKTDGENNVKLYGGNYNFNPAKWVEDEYKVVNSETLTGYYTVVEQVLVAPGTPLEVEADDETAARAMVDGIAVTVPEIDDLTADAYKAYFKLVATPKSEGVYTISAVLNPAVVTPTIAESTEGANDAIVIEKGADGKVTKVTLTVSNALPGLYYGVAIMPTPSSAVEDYVMNSTPYTGTAKGTTTVDFEATDSDADDVAKLTDAAVFFKVLVDFED